MLAVADVREALKAGRLDQAVHLAEALVSQNAECAEGWFYLGCALQMQGQFVRAEKPFREVLARNPGNYAAAENLVQVLFALGSYTEAVKVIDPFCLDTGSYIAWLWRARNHVAAMQYLEGLADYRQVLRRAADDPDIQVEYWNAAFACKDFLTALIGVSSYAWRDSAFESVARELAMFMVLGSQWPVPRIEALIAWIGQMPAEPGAFFRMSAAVHLISLGLNTEGLRLLSSNGNEPLPELAYFALLAKGDWLNGWPLYQTREQGNALVKEALARGIPEWKGEPLSGKTLLIQEEQGLGDMLMALRYLPSLASQGARLMLHVRPDVLSLLGGGAEHEAAELVVNTDEADFQVRLMDLPVLVGRDAPYFTDQVPYLCADNVLLEQWAGRMPAAPVRIGLVWAGNPDHGNDIWRSTELADWLPCFSLPGVDWVLLQKGRPAAEVVLVNGHQNVHDLGPMIRTLADTAAILSHLDLLVSVDTSPAHLAGGMGLPVWVLLNACGQDWRWGEREERTAWYPSMTLLRMAHRQSAASYISQILRPRLIDHLLATSVNRLDEQEKAALLQLRDGRLMKAAPCHERVVGEKNNWTHWACELAKQVPAAVDDCVWGRRLARRGLLWSETHADYDQQALWQAASVGTLSPLNVPVLLNLASKEQSSGYRDFLASTPDQVLAKLLWALLQMRSGTPAIATRAVIEDLLKQFPRNPYLQLEFARLCMQMPALVSQAQTTISRLLLSHPDRADVWMFAADILARAGVWDGCEQVILHARDMGWRDWDLALLEKAHAETASAALSELSDAVRAEIAALPCQTEADIARFVSNHIRCCGHTWLPDFPESHMSSVRFGLGWHALALGRWQVGWPLILDHLHRRHAPVDLPVPASELPSGCLVYQDQGLGDAIMSLRELHPYLQRSDITLSVFGDLLPLLQAQDWALQMVHKSDFDVQKKAASSAISLTELLARHSVELNGPVPMNKPYLVAPSKYLSDTAAIFANESRLRVGIIWAGNRGYGNDAFRSTHLRDWVALAAEDRICLYSLQKDEPSMEAFYVPELPLEVIAHHLNSLADTAGVLMHLDLLITVDSGVAHLAGALGVPVWLLVPAWCTDWRWGYSGDGSAWYPSMRIWRQQKHEAWRDVIGRVKVALSDLAAARVGHLAC